MTRPLFIALVLLVGCRSSTVVRPDAKAPALPAAPAPPVSEAPDALRDCPSAMKPPVTKDVCADLFFGDLPCARCQAAGCYDASDGVFCVRSCTDERCTLQVPDGPR